MIRDTKTPDGLICGNCANIDHAADYRCPCDCHKTCERCATNPGQLARRGEPCKRCDAALQIALGRYESADLQIDDDALVVHTGPYGTWVQAWVRVEPDSPTREA